MDDLVCNRCGSLGRNPESGAIRRAIIGGYCAKCRKYFRKKEYNRAHGHIPRPALSDAERHRLYLESRKRGNNKRNEKRKSDPEFAAKEREWKRRWKLNHPEKHKEIRSANKRLYKKRKLSESPAFLLNYRISKRLRDVVGKSKRNRPTEDLVGYTMEELRRHLERLFLPGMSWSNYGDWHIDHIVPVSAFNFSTPDDLDFKRCWALSNLQPLWAEDNVRKSNKLLKPFQPALQLCVNA